MPVVVLAAVVQSVLPGRRREHMYVSMYINHIAQTSGASTRERVRVEDSVLVEEGGLVAEDATMLFSVVRLAAGRVSQTGGFQRAAALAALAPTDSLA